MAGSLGTLAIELAANTAQLTSDMGKAVGIVERSASNMGRALKGIATGALISGIGAAALKSIEFGDNLSKAATKAGVGAKAISELAYAARLSDIDLTSLSTALRKMQVALSQAGSGAKEPTEALRALGLSMQDLAGLSADRQFELIGDRISKLKDPADRARAATELFGKAGADLLPLFEQGAEGIRKAREEADKLGLSFSGEQLKALSDADDAIKSLKASVEGLALALTAKAAPSLAYFAKELQSLVSGQKIDKIATLREEIRVLQDSIDRGGGSMLGLDPFVSLGAAGGAPDVEAGIYTLEEQVKKVNELRQKLFALAGTPRGAGRYKQPDFNKEGAPPGFTGPNPWEQEYKDRTELANVIVSAKKVHAQTLGEMADDTRDFAQTEVDAYRKKMGEINQLAYEGAIDQKEYDRRTAYWQEYYDREQLSDVQVTAQRSAETWKENLDTMHVYADQAARNMQDAFADFLFDPFHDGLKGMLKGFIDIIRRMAAEAAAAQIFGSKSSGGFGLGDLFKIGVGAAVSGGSESSSIPTGPTTGELFGAGPSLVGNAYPSYGASGAGNQITVAPVYQIDARGATPDVIKQLPAIMEANSRRTVQIAKAEIYDELSRRGALA